ncbi:hypothetical protein GCM10023080_011300 [Streptomyces pseudoechinosporeus]
MRPAKLKVTSPGGKARVYVLEGDQYTVGRVAPNHEPDILWRALVAARELSIASGKSLTAFTTTSADQQDAPYDSAARNRTVTVVITPG